MYSIHAAAAELMRRRRWWATWYSWKDTTAEAVVKSVTLLRDDYERLHCMVYRGVYGNGNNSMGMGGNGDNESHSRTPPVRSQLRCHSDTSRMSGYDKELIMQITQQYQQYIGLLFVLVVMFHGLRPTASVAAPAWCSSTSTSTRILQKSLIQALMLNSWGGNWGCRRGGMNTNNRLICLLVPVTLYTTLFMSFGKHFLDHCGRKQQKQCLLIKTNHTVVYV